MYFTTEGRPASAQAPTSARAKSTWKHHNSDEICYAREHACSYIEIVLPDKLKVALSPRPLGNPLAWPLEAGQLVPLFLFRWPCTNGRPLNQRLEDSTVIAEAPS